MDISGVDVDYLNDDEILEICGDIIDTNADEISVLKNVDVNNLSDDKVQEVYDNVLYDENKNAVKFIYLPDEQVLDNNFDIVDMEKDEIALFSGYNINIDNLSDDEVLALYNDTIDTEPMIAFTQYGSGYFQRQFTYYGNYTDANALFCFTSGSVGNSFYDSTYNSYRELAWSTGGECNSYYNYDMSYMINNNGCTATYVFAKVKNSDGTFSYYYVINTVYCAAPTCKVVTNSSVSGDLGGAAIYCGRGYGLYVNFYK